jgi:hypothetical protein
MNAESTTPTRRALRGGTVRWSCRAGDYVLWVRTDSILTSNHRSAWTIRDFWQMRDGDSVTITNRWADLPEWFGLHPTEVLGDATVEMTKRLSAGYLPDDPMEGPSIWRAKAGDRLVWVTTSDSSRPVSEILDLRSCVVALGENGTFSLERFVAFGAPEGDGLPPPDAAAMRAGFDAAASLGIPREFTPEWKFGA